MNAPTPQFQEIRDRREILLIKEEQLRERVNGMRRELGKLSRARHKITQEWNKALTEHNRQKRTESPHPHA